MPPRLERRPPPGHKTTAGTRGKTARAAAAAAAAAATRQVHGEDDRRGTRPTPAPSEAPAPLAVETTRPPLSNSPSSSAAFRRGLAHYREDRLAAEDAARRRARLASSASLAGRLLLLLGGGGAEQSSLPATTTTTTTRSRESPPPDVGRFPGGGGGEQQPGKQPSPPVLNPKPSVPARRSRDLGAELSSRTETIPAEPEEPDAGSGDSSDGSYIFLALAESDRIESQDVAADRATGMRRSPILSRRNDHPGSGTWNCPPVATGGGSVTPTRRCPSPRSHDVTPAEQRRPRELLDVTPPTTASRRKPLRNPLPVPRFVDEEETGGPVVERNRDGVGRAGERFRLHGTGGPLSGTVGGTDAFARAGLRGPSTGKSPAARVSLGKSWSESEDDAAHREFKWRGPAGRFGEARHAGLRDDDDSGFARALLDVEDAVLYDSDVSGAAVALDDAVLRGGDDVPGAARALLDAGFFRDDDGCVSDAGRGRHLVRVLGPGQRDRRASSPSFDAPRRRRTPPTSADTSSPAAPGPKPSSSVTAARRSFAPCRAVRSGHRNDLSEPTPRRRWDDGAAAAPERPVSVSAAGTATAGEDPFVAILSSALSLNETLRAIPDEFAPRTLRTLRETSDRQLCSLTRILRDEAEKRLESRGGAPRSGSSAGEDGRRRPAAASFRDHAPYGDEDPVPCACAGRTAAARSRYREPSRFLGSTAAASLPDAAAEHRFLAPAPAPASTAAPHRHHHRHTAGSLLPRRDPRASWSSYPRSSSFRDEESRVGPPSSSRTSYRSAVDDRGLCPGCARRLREEEEEEEEEAYLAAAAESSAHRNGCPRCRAEGI